MEQKRQRSVFYWVLLGILVLLLLVFVYIRFGLLRPWLTRYEASQPKHVSQEVFDDLFSPADWGRVYDLAGLEGNREQFVETLEELTAGQELTLVETSAGLSGDRRYLVKLGMDSVAAFTLTGETEEKTSAWKLGQVELLLELPSNTLRIRTLDSHRVLVNGEELGVDCQAQFTETAAERYLPEGVFGRRTILWQPQVGVAGMGEVTVLNAKGEEVPLDLDPESGIYTVRETAEEPTDQERTLLLGAAKSYARYMIRESDSAQLQKYFDRESAIYQTIRSSEIWIKHTAGHTFSQEEISEFYRYGEDLFSARVSMHMDVKRGNGSQKPYEVDSTFFFHRKNGVWRAFDMTNADVQKETVHTRLVFMDGEEELGRLFVSSEERSFAPPAVPSRPSQRFVGWALREQEGASVTMTVVFQPGEDGMVHLPAGYVLEPVTLYAVFESE